MRLFGLGGSGESDEAKQRREARERSLSQGAAQLGAKEIAGLLSCLLR